MAADATRIRCAAVLGLLGIFSSPALARADDDAAPPAPPPAPAPGQSTQAAAPPPAPQPASTVGGYVGAGFSVMGAIASKAVGPAIELVGGINRSNSELGAALSFVPGRAPGFGLNLRWLAGPNLGPVRLLFGLEGGAVLLVPALANTIASGSATTVAFDVTGNLLAASFRLGPMLFTIRALSVGAYLPLPRGDRLKVDLVVGGGVSAAYAPGGSS
jgi:hypothetical protein